MLFDTVGLFVPGKTPGFAIFSCLPFVNTTTQEVYYDYKYFIAGGILLNCIATYAAEKLIIEKVTKSFDIKKEKKKFRQFDHQMESLRDSSVLNNPEKKGEQDEFYQPVLDLYAKDETNLKK